MNLEYQLGNNEVKMKITFATDLEGDPAEIAKERGKFARYLSPKHSINQEKHQDQEKNLYQEKQQDQEKHKDQEKHHDQDKHQDEDKHLEKSISTIYYTQHELREASRSRE